MGVELYGEPRAVYSGTGLLVSAEAEHRLSYFECAQLSNGKIILICDMNDQLLSFPIGATHFSGTDEAGTRLNGVDLFETNYLPEIEGGLEGIWAAFWVRELTAEFPVEDCTENTTRVGLTNFEFAGTHLTPHGTGFRRNAVPLVLQDLDGTIDVTLAQVDEYNPRVERLTTLRETDITCEAIFVDNGQDIERIATHLSYLLSVARGTKIQWVYKAALNRQGECIKISHISRITRPYTHSPILDPRAGWASTTKQFLEATYPIFIQRVEAYELEAGLLDAYMDAKAEASYIELRALKLAGALEALKNTFIHNPDSGVSEFIVSTEQYAEQVGTIQEKSRAILRTAGFSHGDCQAIINDAKLRGLNRRGFSHVLGKLLRMIELNVRRSDINSFVASRNSLVHTGKFYVQTADEDARTKCQPLESKKHEFRFMLHFLDQVILKLLGYTGPYVSWADPRGPINSQLL